MNRKDFLKTGSRVLLLAGLGVSTIYLVSNKQVKKKSECTINPACTSCSRFSGCNLPQAEKTRKNGKESRK